MATPSGRYAGLAVRVFGHGASAIPYIALRRCPDTPADPAYFVMQNDRPDLIAWRLLGDATAFWRLADANQTRDPFELTDTPGQSVKVPWS
jgi:hypothetical protein